MPNLRESSKLNWDGGNKTESIKLGCLQRIADAAEIMATNYINLQNELDIYKRWYNERCEVVKRRDKYISSLRGQITKLKNKLEFNNQ